MKSLITKLALVGLLAISSTPMHGNWLTNINHGISNSVFGTINRAIWRAKAFWQCGFLAARRWEPLTNDERLTLIAAGRIKANKLAKIHNEDSKVLLKLAAENDNAEAVKNLIKAGAAVNSKDKSWTLLHRAAWRKSPQVTKALINAGANVNAKNRVGETPLHVTAWGLGRNHESKTEIAAAQVAKLLIDKNADVNAKNFYGQTPLHSVVWGESPKLAQRLLDAGADVTAKSSDGKTPLHIAGWNPKVAKLLLDRGADVNAKDSKGQTPLHRTAYWCNHATYDLLLKSGALQIKDNEGITPENLLKKCNLKKQSVTTWRILS